MSPDPRPTTLDFVLPYKPTGVSVVEVDTAAWIVQRRRQDLEEAYRRGLAEGEQRAMGTAAATLERAAQRVDEAREKAAPELASAAIELGTEIARAIVRNEISAGHHNIERMVRETLAASGAGRGTCVVHVHPRDVERLRSVPFRSGTVVESDPEVAEGDVHVTTAQGLLVRDIEGTLLAIRGRLHGELT